MGKRALITGIAGQDGAYLAALLHGKGYEVFGIDCAGVDLWRLRELGVAASVRMLSVDLLSPEDIFTTLHNCQPDEIYNLAAHSFVADSFKNPASSMETDVLAVIRLWDAARKAAPEARIFQASTAELFGQSAFAPQSEETPFHPRSPYGVGKLAAHWSLVNARETFGVYACNGILYNHESPLRGRPFVTRKITAELAKIKCGQAETLFLGNLNAQRDWGFAGDYVRGMWLMLQQEKPDDYILATGQTHTVRDFVEAAAKPLGFDLVWDGSLEEEVGREVHTGQVLVRVDPSFYRPVEPDLLCGDATKARTVLGWTREVSFSSMVQFMVEADLRRAQEGLLS